MIWNDETAARLSHAQGCAVWDVFEDDQPCNCSRGITLAHIATLAKRVEELTESLAVAREIEGTFWEAIKPLKLEAINVANPGSHVTDVINERDTLRADNARLREELEQALALLAEQYALAHDTDAQVAAGAYEDGCLPGCAKAKALIDGLPPPVESEHAEVGRLIEEIRAAGWRAGCHNLRHGLEWYASRPLTIDADSSITDLRASGIGETDLDALRQLRAGLAKRGLLPAQRSEGR